MFQQGALFNISVSDIVGLLKDSQKEQIRKDRKELSKIGDKIQNLNKLFVKSMDEDELKVLKEMRDSMKSRETELQKSQTKSEIEKKIKPQQSFLQTTIDKIDNLTGVALDLSQISGATVFKLTTLATGALLAPAIRSMSNLNDIITEIGVNSDHILENFIELNNEMVDMARSGDRIKGSSIAHMRSSIEIQQQYGMMASSSSATLETVSTFPYALGLSREAGVEFLNTLRGITGESQDINSSLIRSLANLSEVNNLPMQYIMDDISNNAEFFALRSGTGSENMARTVLSARRLGIELSTISSMLSGLETVEGVIESQMKMSLFTGQQINLLDSATANFFGDTEEATLGILRQLEKIDEATFDQPFVRKQMAEQLGVSATELNNIYETVQRIGAQDVIGSLGFDDSLEEFRDTLSGIGMTRIRNSISRDIIDPIQNALSKNAKWLDSFAKKISGMISFIGNSVLAPMFEAMPVAMTVMTGVGGLIATIGAQGLLQMEGNQLLRIIASNTAVTAGDKGVSTIWGGKKASIQRGLGLAGTASGAIGVGASWMNDRETYMQAGMSGLLAGGSTGAMVGGVPGALIGGAIGGAVGLAGEYVSHNLAEGGIVTEHIVANVGEGKKKEAVIPLDSSRGKEMIQTNLTDNSIEKLAKAIAREGVNVNIQYSYNGKKMDDSEKFFKEIAK